MRSIVKVFAVLLLFAAGSHDSFAKTSKKPPALSACPKVINVGGSFVYKNSAPVRSSVTGLITGFRSNPTLIMNISGVNQSGTTIFDTSGHKVGSCPWSQANGAAGGRYRCTMDTASLRRSAESSSHKPSVLFSIGGGRCVLIPDAGRCYGSNKGLCDRTLQ